MIKPFEITRIENFMNRNLIIITTGIDYGGAETQLVRIATRLRQRAWNVRIVSMLPPKAFQAELEKADVALESLEMKRGVPSPLAFIKLCRILKQHRPSVVLSFMIHANIMARVARLFTHIPVLVCSARNVSEQSSTGGDSKWRDRAYRLTDALCDLTVQNSEAGRARYVSVRAVPPQKITVIPNGLDLKRFQPCSNTRRVMREVLEVDNDTFVWLAVGRLQPQKDYPLMLAAFAQVVGFRKTKLVIVGKGSQRHALEEMARKYDILEQVLFYGLSDNVSGLMSAADSLVLTSAWEGLPNVLIEASAMELPCVTTAVGGSAEIVQDGVTGIVVSERSPTALANAMKQLMSLELKSLQEMGRLARQHAQHAYEIEAVVSKWENVLLQSCSS